MSRKVILVPKDKIHQAALNFDKCSDDGIHFIDISSEDMVDLYNIGFFDTINLSIGCLIDDYKSEEIVNIDDLMTCKQICEQISFRRYILVREIKKMFDLAIHYRTGVFFYF